MEQKAIDQIHLCLNELQMMKQLIDLKVADDFCSRMMGIYVMMRVDDITKIWCHNIPQNTMERYLVEDVKSQYNAGLRTVRDKLGAHYQSPSAYADLFGSMKIFKSIDYANTVCLIDAIMEVETQIEGKELAVAGFKDESDSRTARDVLTMLNSDGQAYLTNGALDVFGINKGGLISTTAPQVKGQYLKSLELMVEVAHELLKPGYKVVETERMFKRLYVCMVFNYHDNLITRKDIDDKAVQYEEGFDILFRQLITKNDDETMLLKAFDDFETLYQVEPVVKKYRKVRDHACAHLDEACMVENINKELDAVNVSELEYVYENMLNMFNFICGKVLCLSMLNIPARTPVFGARMETIEDNENFYGELSEDGLPQERNSTEILRSIRKRDQRYGEACDALTKKLMAEDDATYLEMIGAISQRLREPEVTDAELSVIINSLHHARRGYPERLQRSLVGMMQDEVIFRYHNAHLLWLLSTVCREDKLMDIPKLLDSVIVQGKAIPTALSLLALLHLRIEQHHSIYVDRNKAHEVADDLKKSCDGISHPTEKCATMLMLVQHWFWDMEYGYYRSYEQKYSDYLTEEALKALHDYFYYVKLKDEDERTLCEKYLKSHYCLLLLYRLAYLEKVRNQKPNIFLEMWRYNCFVRPRQNMYEAFGVGLMTELAGDKTGAKKIFETILEDNPINKDAINTLEDFCKRNPEI